VGNKAAVFPLQLLGFDVDVINSVHFSNHTGHLHGWEGDVLNGNQLRSILDGLGRNGLLQDVGHLLTGYIGSESFLRAVLDVLKALRQHSHVRYICDPVLGDMGKLYVPPELVSVYKDEVIPLADVLTPNQFEVEQLTGIQVKNIADARKACSVLHDLGPEMVLITSMVLEEEEQEIGGEKAGEGSIAIFASRRSREAEPSYKADEIWRIDSPVVPGRFTGTGDLCAALFLAWTAIYPDDFPMALEKVIGTMYSVIKRTNETPSHSVVSRELRLIQSKSDIENPPQIFKAQRLS